MATRHRSPIEPHPRIRHRKSAEKLRSDQLQALREAFEAIKGRRDNTGFWHWAEMHGTPGGLCRHTPRSGVDSLFLPWHRAYLYRLELALQTQVRKCTLPWWDWPTSAEGDGIPVAYAEETVDGQPNPLAGADLPALPNEPSGWPTRTSREPGSPSRLPSLDRIEDALSRSSFNDFSLALEEIHNEVHGWAGGTMGFVATAAYDPIFWAHHTMVDRLWSIWQVRHSDPGPRPDQWGIGLEGLDLTVEDVLDTTGLGYDYAGSTEYREPEAEGRLAGFTTQTPFPVPSREGQPAFKRADLRFLGVEHRGDSFEGRVFLDQPDATPETPRDPDSGYAGSFYVFGHGPCFGDDGHCQVPQGPIHPFDFRRPHPLNPELHAVDVTDALGRALQDDKSEVNVTVVPTNARDEDVGEILGFERVGLVTYD